MESPAKESAVLIIPEARPRQKKNGQRDLGPLFLQENEKATAGLWGRSGSPSLPGENEMGALHAAIMRKNDSRPFGELKILSNARKIQLVQSNI